MIFTDDLTPNLILPNHETKSTSSAIAADAGCYFNHHRPLRSWVIRHRAVAASAVSLFDALHATIISQQSINFLRYRRRFCCSNFGRHRRPPPPPLRSRVIRHLNAALDSLLMRKRNATSAPCDKYGSLWFT